MQTDVDYRLGTDWRIGGGYVFDVAKVTEYNPTGARCAARRQVPCPGPEASGLGARVVLESAIRDGCIRREAIGRQFEDDLNLLVVPAAALATQVRRTTEPGLPGYAVANLTVSRSIVREVDVFFGVQNLFGRGVLRRPEADDHRLAAAGAGRRARAFLGTVRPRPRIRPGS